MRNEPDLISVIIPVYNVEQYIRKCILSVISQTYRSIEIILINDGSKDESGRICDELAEMDDRIKVIHQSNAGVSAARNVGLNVASGTYVCFVDSDDSIESGFLQTLLQNMKSHGAQLGIIGYKRSQEETVGKTRLLPSSRSETICNMLTGTNYFGHPWGKLFLRDIIDRHKIRFDTSLWLCEDLLFCVQYSTYIERAVFDSSKLYVYFPNENSVNGRMRQGFDEKYLNRLDAVEKIVSELRNEMSREILNAVSYQRFFSSLVIWNLVTHQQEQCYSELTLQLRQTMRQNVIPYILVEYRRDPVRCLKSIAKCTLPYSLMSNAGSAAGR